MRTDPDKTKKYETIKRQRSIEELNDYDAAMACFFEQQAQIANERIARRERRAA